MSDIERDENFIKALDQFSKDYILSCIDRTEAKARAFGFGVGYEAAKQDVCEWQPIDTVPKNLRVLIYTVSNNIYSAHWVQHPETAHESFLICEDDEGNQSLIKEDLATHWQPLPQPPGEQS